MNNFITIAQIVVAASVAFVWIFRTHNVVKEFGQFGLSILVRSFVGFSKTVLATLLVVGIWFPSLILFSALFMGFFMVAAQYFHFKANNPMKQRLPSLILLVLCTFIVLNAANLL